jgi:hypothetical protein
MVKKAERYSTAWQQFLVAKRTMLDAYDRARTHARTQTVKTHHGVVAESAVRDWLASFLPKRYGIASGYIRSQSAPTPHQTKHFDVIVYDQLEAPTLWVEENKEKSESGKIKIVPAEFVKAVLEVKSTFSRRTVREGIAKLAELAPLMSGVDAASEIYPRFLPASAVLAMVFFELRMVDRKDVEALNLLRDANFQRTFYGATILRGEGKDPDDTGISRKYFSELPLKEMLTANGLLHGMTMTATKESNSHQLGAMLKWSDTSFSEFAFDLLALLNGTYRPGYASSFHGLELRKPDKFPGRIRLPRPR